MSAARSGRPAPSLRPPAAIAAWAGHMAADSGVSPTVEHVGEGRWRITVDTGRVQMWVIYRALSRGRLKWTASQLFIDGVQVNPATTYEELLRIIHDPDQRDEPQPVTFVDVDPAEAPAQIQAVYHALGRALSDLPAGTRMGLRRDGRRWQVVVENEWMCLRCGFVDGLMNPGRPQEPLQVSQGDPPVELVLDGVDVTDQVHGRMDQALAMIRSHPSAPPPPAVPHDRPAATNTGVRVRKQTVLRL